ncbi:MAG: hypothetical protein WCS38_01635 [Mesotoga sp.]
MKRLELEEIKSRKRPLIVATVASVCWSLLSFNAYSVTFVLLSAIVWLYYYLSRTTLKTLTITRSIDRERLFSGETLTLKYSVEGSRFISLSTTVFP